MASGSLDDDLYELLFKYYNREIRPSEYTGHVTEVKVSPNLYSIVEVIEDAETLRFSRWYQMFWNDFRLRWDPFKFNGTKELLVDVKKVWIPDIVVIEQLRDYQMMMEMNFVSISYTGDMRFSYNDICEIYCHMDVEHFPFDQQNCSVSYVSWEYPANQLIVNAADTKHGFLMFYGYSSAWELMDYTYLNDLITDNDTISFDTITFYIVFRRKPMYYVLSIIMPSFLVTTLTILGMFSPSFSTNVRVSQVSVGLQGALAMSVVLLMVTSTMPKHLYRRPSSDHVFGIGDLGDHNAIAFDGVSGTDVAKLGQLPGLHAAEKGQVISQNPAALPAASHQTGRSTKQKWKWKRVRNNVTSKRSSTAS